MLVGLITLLSRTVHSIALLYVTYFCYRPRQSHILESYGSGPRWGVTAGKLPIGLFGHCGDRRRVSLVDFYRRSQHPTLITAVPYEKVVGRTAINVLGCAIACRFRRTLLRYVRLMIYAVCHLSVVCL